MIVNDMITLGALPISVAMHLAVGSSDWFQDLRRMEDLVAGWRHACELARCVWSGGETPTLKGIVYPQTILLSGSALGIAPKEFIIKPRLEAGTVIMLLGSSGIHANGLTLARQIAEKLPDGYATLLSNGQPYGEALLEPTHIYVPVMDDLLRDGVLIRYAVNITGHGWRKLMRAREPFVYVIEDIPQPQPVFRFIAEHGPVSQREMYGNYNMGAGFALYVDEADVQKVIEVSSQHGMTATRAGYVDRHGDDKKVIIKPLNLEYDAAELQVR
jgi:phosphoribosylformylglycinamidine cyclo-ligase